MMNFINKCKNIPIGITGLGLGLGGLGNIWAVFLHEIFPKTPQYITSIVQYFCIFFTITFILLIFLRNINHKNIFKQEIQHPLLSSFLPTIFMGLMLIGGFFAEISNLAHLKSINALNIIGASIWYLAIIGHLTILTLFIYFVVSKHNIKSDSLYGSWFVPPVGIIVSCTVAKAFNNQLIPHMLFQIIWFFGFGLYFLILPIISYKLIFHSINEKITFPSIAIYGAPANLSLAGFIAAFTEKNGDIYVPVLSYYSITFVNVIIICLTFLSILTTLIVYMLLPKILLMKFSPVFASLTFPLAIAATAIHGSMLYFHSLNIQNINISYLHDFINTLFCLIKVIFYVEIIIATIIITYVFINYLILLFKIFFVKTSI